MFYRHKEAPDRIYISINKEKYSVFTTRRHGFIRIASSFTNVDLKTSTLFAPMSAKEIILRYGQGVYSKLVSE